MIVDTLSSSYKTETLKKKGQQLIKIIVQTYIQINKIYEVSLIHRQTTKYPTNQPTNDNNLKLFKGKKKEYNKPNI